MRKIALLTMVVILAALLAACAGGGEEEVDQTAPVISAVSASSITETGAVITWTTNESATSQVEYGPTTSYGSTTTLEEDLETSHSVSLSELAAGTTYHYRAKSKDASENEKTSGDYTFTTTSAGDTTPPVISGVSASGITISTASITWTTDEPATSRVEYGLTTSYGSTADSPLPALVTNHSVSLSDLAAGTTYHYRVKSQDASENIATSGDYTFTTRSLLIAFIYSTDATGANSYESLLEDEGYSVTLIPLSAVASTDFSIYGLIIVGPDTRYEWDDAASVGAIQDSEKPIIGLHKGGASLFQQLGLSINWDHGMDNPEETGIYVIDPSHPIFNSPNSIAVPENRIVQLYSSPCSAYLEYAPHISPDVTPLGRYIPGGYYALVQEEQYMLWSFAASPESMTQLGKDLFLNVVNFMLTTAFPPDTTPPVISEIGASGITTSTATITWTTDVGATSQVEYGPTISYGTTTTLDEGLVYSHSVSLSGLAADTTYHYRVKSKDASENQAMSGDNTFTTATEAQQWAAYAFDQTVTPTSGNPGTIESFTIIETYTQDSTTWQFQVTGTYLGIENTEIKTNRMVINLEPPYGFTQTTVSTLMDCYKIEHHITVLEAPPGEDYPEWAEVTVWIPTEEFATTLQYFWIYPKAEYVDSEQNSGTWSYYLTQEMQDEMNNPPPGKQIVYSPYIEGEFYGYDTWVLSGLYGWGWWWFGAYAMGEEQYFEEGEWTWDFDSCSSTVSCHSVTEDVGSYTFSAWSLDISWTCDSDTGTYRGVFSPDLPLPIYLEVGGGGGDGVTYWEYELTDLTLE